MIGRAAVFLFAVLAAPSAALAEEPPPILDCNALAVAPWVSAGEGYRVQAQTIGEDCAGAALTLALIAPSGRAAWEHEFGGAAAVRVLYGVPNGAAMEAELQAWIAQTTKPATTAALPAWPEGEASPAGFEPNMGRAEYEEMRRAGRPVFCFADAPGFLTCLQLLEKDEVKAIGRAPTR